MTKKSSQEDKLAYYKTRTLYLEGENKRLTAIISGYNIDSLRAKLGRLHTFANRTMSIVDSSAQTDSEKLAAIKSIAADELKWVN